MVLPLRRYKPGLPALELIANPILLMCVVTLAGFLLRLRGVTWGLPHLYDPDEPTLVDPAVRFVTTGDLNPHWFGYPGSSIMYLLGLAYLCYWLLGHLLGWFPDLQSFATLFWTDPTSFYLIARILTIALATLTIPLTYAIGRRVTGKAAAFAAAILVAVSPLHVNFSRQVRTDPPMTTFILLSVLFAFKATERQWGRDFLLSGICAGLATATKWPGITATVPVVLATGLATPERSVSWRARTRWLALVFLGLLIGFLVAAPYVPLEIPKVMKDLTVEARHVHLSAAGSPGASNYLWYLTGPLQEALGWPIELFALVGVAATCQTRVRLRLLLISFSLVFFLGIGLLHLRWDRWIVPLVPSLAIFAAIGLEVVSRMMPWVRRLPMAKDLFIVGLGVALVFPSALEAFRNGTTSDTRDIAKAWIERHIPAGSKIAVEQYTPPISRDSYHVFVFQRGSLRRDTTTRGWKADLGELAGLQPLREEAIEYVVLSNWFDRFQAEQDRYPGPVRFYGQLFASSDLIYELNPTGTTPGPTIRVLRFRQ